MLPASAVRPLGLHRSLCQLAACAAVCVPGVADAQNSQQPLPPTREEVSRPEQEQQRRALRLDVEGGIERAPCALDSPEFQNVRFTLRGARFEGLEGVSPGDLEPAYRPLVGTEQPISVVCELRDRAAAILRKAGYIAAVEVPEQRIADGIVHFRVLLAQLKQVRVRGNAAGAEKIIAAFLNQLTRQPVFNRFQAERYLLLASDLPGYTVRLTLRPAGTGPGQVLGDVTVQRTPAYADLNIQNGGSNVLGRWGGFARTQLYGLTGLADRTTLAAFVTSDFREQRTVQAGHDMWLGADGLHVGALLTYAWAKPSLAGDDKLNARSFLATIQADFPLVRSLARTIRATVGMDIVNQDVAFNSVDLSRDRLRVGFARLAFDALGTEFSGGRSFAEPAWRVAAVMEARKGMAILGATRLCTSPTCGDAVPPSRQAGLSTAGLVRGLLSGDYRPVPKLTLSLAARGQYAWKPLLSFEEFAAGNYTVGRGYDPGALLGDRGWGTRAEIRAGSTIPVSAGRPAGEAYLFLDHARVSDMDGQLVRGSRRLNSAGGGVRVAYDRFWLDAALAVPLSRIGVPEKRPDPRFLVSLTTRVWPWSYK